VEQADEGSGPVISTIGWILIGVAAWLLVAVLVGLVIGRMIRLRDRQFVDPPVEQPGLQIPVQNRGRRPEQDDPGQHRQG
jgi:hypothetical protein